MNLKNKTAAFFTIIVIAVIVAAIYRGIVAPVTVIIQAGHEGRTCGNTGAVCDNYKEVAWNIRVADKAAETLRHWGVDVKRVAADAAFEHAEIAVAVHFDSAKRPCRSGASVGYPDNNASARFAEHWKGIYRRYFPFKWHKDNFTDNLKHYYAYRRIKADKFVVMELGELTCKQQTDWLYPRLDRIGELIAYAIATELGKHPPKPRL